ncbi:MAG: hypothetical protein AAGH88_03400 [Planctomycetota bacterium]
MLSSGVLGCSWQRPDGSHRHLVLGIGLVDVDQSGGRVLVGDGVDARAVRLRAVGAMVGSGPGLAGLGVGVIEQQSVEVAPDSDLILDWGPGDDGSSGSATLRVRRAE